jgi:DNA-binding MarR family transcriptional regulator
MALSNFRHRLACFVRFSTDASRSAGLTMTQYLLLLHLAGRPGREWAHVGELAECLQASPHGTVALVDRCEALGLVERRPSADDGRSVEVHLTPGGSRMVERIANLHRSALQTFRDVFRVQNVNDLPPSNDGGDIGVTAKRRVGRHHHAARGVAPRRRRTAES